MVFLSWLVPSIKGMVIDMSERTECQVEQKRYIENANHCNRQDYLGNAGVSTWCMQSVWNDCKQRGPVVNWKRRVAKEFPVVLKTSKDNCHV